MYIILYITEVNKEESKSNVHHLHHHARLACHVGKTNNRHTHISHTCIVYCTSNTDINFCEAFITLSISAWIEYPMGGKLHTNEYSILASSSDTNPNTISHVWDTEK